mmetsp:Transcript_71652/g.203306  ORF Transcript_71652/g.203306 Transcript_71652/m.203306 type:complete len:239 (-) Transcript_71652:295-1011(-)
MNVFFTVILRSSTLSGGPVPLEPLLGEFPKLPRPPTASRRTCRPPCVPGGDEGGGEVTSCVKAAGAAYRGGAGRLCGVGAPSRAVQDCVTRRLSTGEPGAGSTSMNVFFTVYFSSPSSDRHRDTRPDPVLEATPGEVIFALGEVTAGLLKPRSGQRPPGREPALASSSSSPPLAPPPLATSSTSESPSRTVKYLGSGSEKRAWQVMAPRSCMTWVGLSSGLTSMKVFFTVSFIPPETS